MSSRPTQEKPVLIVGAGVSGLCCAIHLERCGIPVRLLESDDQAGGRVQTDRVAGFSLDRGFQVLLTAYPEVRAMLDLDALQLGGFAPGAMIRIDDAFARVADPLRRPSDILATLRSGVATPLDALRIARLRWRVSRGDPMELLEAPSRGILDSLRAEGFSQQIIDRFFRPFLAGVLLDREVRGSSRALDFFFRMFAEGEVALPAQGMGAVSRQLASRLRPGTLRTRARVRHVEASCVTLENGERLESSAVVLATAARAAAKLVPGLRVPESNAACCLYFDAPQAPAVGNFLVLDGNGTGPVNELCVPSEVNSHYAPAGRSLVSASVLEPFSQDDATLEAAVRQQLSGWFGAAVRDWRLLRIDRIEEALPSQPAGPFEPMAYDPQIAERLLICGDHRDLASLQGAMASGRRAALRLTQLLS